MNISYIRQRPLFKKTRKPKLLLSQQNGQLIQSKLSVDPSSEGIEQWFLQTQPEASPEQSNISETLNHWGKMKTQCDQMDNSCIFKNQQRTNSQDNNMTGFHQEYKFLRCRKPGFPHHNRHSRHHLSITSYHSRPTIAPNDKQKSQKIIYNSEIEKKVSSLQLRIQQQTHRSEQTFDTFDELERQHEEQKTKKYNEYIDEANLLKDRIMKQKSRNDERLSKKRAIVSQICHQIKDNSILQILQGSIAAELYSRYPQGLPDSPQKFKKQSNQSTIRNLEVQSSYFEPSQENRVLKEITNRSTFAHFGPTPKETQSSQSILLDDSIFG